MPPIPARAERLLRRACLLVMLAPAAAPAEEPPFSLEPPPGLHAAPVSRAASGNTYTWLPADLSQPTRLMLTLMPANEVRARLGEFRPAQCLRLFLDELRHDHAHFFAVEQSTPLELGAARLARVRWTGLRHGRELTGVLACGAEQDRYYVVHYVDALARASRSFVDIRAALASFTPHP